MNFTLLLQRQFSNHRAKGPTIKGSYNEFLETVTLSRTGVKQLGEEVLIDHYSRGPDRDSNLTVVSPRSC